STKRIVERYTIGQDERAASTARPYSPQCYALACRIGRPASGPAKETESLNLSQSVVKRQSGCVGKVRLRNDNYTARRVINSRLGPRRRHRHLLTHAGRRDNKIQIQTSVERFQRPFAFERRETAGLYLQRSSLGRYALKRELSFVVSYCAKCG